MRKMLGKIFGKLTVKSFSHKDARYNDFWNVQCQCGTEKSVRGSHLRNGSTQSCGCLVTEVYRKRNTKHGMSGSPEWQSWKAMRQRCINPKHVHFKYYGGRGITICKRWLGSFETFLQDMGRRPKGTTIHRVNDYPVYCPEHCIWAPADVQAKERRKRTPYLEVPAYA